MSNGITPLSQPVSGFPITFRWQTGDWYDLFQEHIAVIQRDIQRALAGERLVVYLSCPISSYGGSFYATNVEIANFTVQRLLNSWGTRLWFLNPAQYQMESEAGLGLIRDDAREIMLKQRDRKIDVDKLMRDTPAQGGDYMRMWTRVLVEDDAPDKDFLGARFSAFYFLGPSDVREFFIAGGYQNLSYAIDDYFARKSGTDYGFRQYFYPPFRDDKGAILTGDDEKKEWAKRRQDFFRFYSVKASAAYSRGSHDEWNIWCILNERRRAKLGLGFQIPGYWGGQAIDPAAAEKTISPGNAV